MSKVAEKIILKRINKHDDSNKIFKNFQFGFRSQHSTTQQICRIVTELMRGYNNEEVTVIALLDVKKLLTEFGRKDSLPK